MIRLNLQMFGGGGSGANTGPNGKSESTTKEALSHSNGHGSAGGRGMDGGSPEYKPKEDNRTTLAVPYATGERYYVDPVSKIENGERYFFRLFRANGSSVAYEILTASEARELLRGYKFDKRYGIWYSRGATKGFSVHKIKK